MFMVPSSHCFLLVPFTTFLSLLPCALSTLPCCFHCSPIHCEFLRQRHPWCFQKERATHKERFEHIWWKAEAVFPVWPLLTGCSCERPCHSPGAEFVCSAEQAGEHLILWEYQMFTQWDVSEQLKHSACVLVTCPAEHKAYREPWSTKNLRGCLWSTQVTGCLHWSSHSSGGTWMQSPLPDVPVQVLIPSGGTLQSTIRNTKGRRNSRSLAESCCQFPYRSLAWTSCRCWRWAQNERAAWGTGWSCFPRTLAVWGTSPASIWTPTTWRKSLLKLALWATWRGSLWATTAWARCLQRWEHSKGCTASTLPTTASLSCLHPSASWGASPFWMWVITK